MTDNHKECISEVVENAGDEAVESAVEEAVDEAIEEAIEDAVEEALEHTEASVWKKLQTSIVMLAALMISAGQWTDTMEVASSLYYVTMANFTNSLEYEKIESINVGNSLGYIHEILGQAHVIKSSQIEPTLTFHYYTESKFDLTIMLNGERVAGYGVFTKEVDFTPPVPFSEKLGASSLANQNQFFNEFHFDSHNLVYFLEHQSSNDFLTLIQGYVEYGAPNSLSDSKQYQEKLAKLLRELDQQLTFSESKQQVADQVAPIRELIYPNFFVVTELPTVIVAESLLSRFEYKMYTKS